MKTDLRPWLAKATAVLFLCLPAWAGPTGPQVTTGNATVQSSGPNTTIVQSGERAIIQWEGFSIGLGESVQFIQPSALSAVLNRVVGADPSIILGALRANGQVFLVNPNGVFFGAGAQVDVGSLVVTTLNLSDQDFMAGNHHFTQHDSAELAAIVNQGTLSVQDNGFLILAAPHVSNEGLLVASQGKIALAGGEQAAVSFDGSGLINFQVADLANDKSTVLMPTDTVSDVLDGVVSNPGILEGTELAVVDGQVQLVNGSGTVLNSGTIAAESGQLSIDSSRGTVLTESSQMEAQRALVLSQGQTTAIPGSHLEIGPQDGFAELSGKHIVAGLTVTGDGSYLIDPVDLTIANGPMPGMPAADTVYEEALEASAVPIFLQADETITVEDIADNEVTLANDIGIFLTTSTPGMDSLIFEDEDDVISTQGAGDIAVDVAGNIASGIFESETVVALLAANIGEDGEPVGVVAPVLSISADGDVHLDTNVDAVTGTAQGDIELKEVDGIELANLQAGGGLILTANLDINGDDGMAPDVSADEDLVLISLLGTVGVPSNSLDVDVGGDLLVSAGGEANGSSVDLSGNVDGNAAVSVVTTGSAELNGDPLPISTDPDFNEEIDDGLLDLTDDLGFDDDEAEELLEELGLLAGQTDHGTDFDHEGPETEEFGPDGEEYGPEESDHGPDEGEHEPGEGEEGEPDDTDPDDSEPEDDGEEKTSGKKPVRSNPYVAQAGLRQRLNTKALMSMNINQIHKVTVEVGQPSPFDAALQSSSITTDDIMDLDPGELNNFNVFLTYDINQDPVITNPALSAGDILELGADDLGDVPISLH